MVKRSNGQMVKRSNGQKVKWSNGQKVKRSRNVLADKGSRSKPIETEWSLDRKTFLSLCKQICPSEELLDMFATWDNSQSRLFVSPCPDPRAWAEDAFTLDWRALDFSIYVFPPPQLLGEVVNRLMSFPGRGFVIGPFWPSKPWFPLLSERCRKRFPLPEDHFLHQETSLGTIVRNKAFALTLFAWVL